MALEELDIHGNSASLLEVVDEIGCSPLGEGCLTALSLSHSHPRVTASWASMWWW